MKKIVISGSASLQDKVTYWRSYFEGEGHLVIDYPKSWDGNRGFEDQFKGLYEDFYKSIEECDVFFLMNEDKKGISGYIGASGAAEIVYAIMQNLLHNRGIEIFIAKMPNEKVFAYEEISNYLKMGWIKIYE